MADKMLIDASHEEETRVVVVRGNRIEEFDFESQHKKQLRGNIYLAKVTRVEPSLQAAFVDYGGNRHGFLAFSEIHPDYYQIPLADRQALLAAEAEEEAERARRENDADEAEARQRGSEPSHDADDDQNDDDSGEDDDEPEEKPARREAKRPARRRRSAKKPAEAAEQEEAAAIDHAVDDLDASGDQAAPDDDGETGEGGGKTMSAVVDADSISEEIGENAEEGEPSDERDPGEVDMEAAQHVEGKSDTLPAKKGRGSRTARTEGDDEDKDDDSENGNRRKRAPRARKGKRSDDGDDNGDDNGARVESIGAEDALEELPDRSAARKPRKQYRIQEVIKRRQIILVQVVKEERGNKGAALTTYLSLAGRYSVLMPNTARGGGISRKITSAPDRGRLKDIARSLEVPKGMGVILRTAGANRTKAEIKRDFEYLMRLWENVRNLTLSSTAPCLVYEEGSLIKRSIRDLYNKDINEVVVSGEEGYREAKDFMKMLMPSHAKAVQPYREVHPIFSRSGIEAQLDRMLQPQVTMKSGGYIIINQTEALVAIDVNSGRSTREHSIEDTALQTNLEAADEVARQLRLRDLAGLIVVDFIDMEEKRNNRAVEKRLKDALKNDRARIQVGRISHFGLLEMSRQRIRASVLESTTQTCEVCGGTGHIRSQSSVALHVIRSIEEFLLKSTSHDIMVRTTPATALYVLNQKRETVVDLERRFGVAITIEADATIGSQHLAIDRGAAVETPVRIEDIVANDMPAPDEEDDDIPFSFDDEEDDKDDVKDQRGGDSASSRDDDADAGQRKPKRRRRRRGGKDRNGNGDETRAASADGGANGGNDEQAATSHAGEQDERGADGDQSRKRRRRGKRGGRRNRGEDGAQTASSENTDSDNPGNASGSTVDEPGATDAANAARDDADKAAAAAQSDAPETAVTSEPVGRDDQDAAIAPAPESEPAEPAKKPRKPRAPRRKKDAEMTEADKTPDATPHHDAKEEPAAATAEPEGSTSDPAADAPDGVKDKPKDTAEKKPKKVGWWQRRGFF